VGPFFVQSFTDWENSDLPAPPEFRARDWTKLIGPGLLMAGSNIGGGEWLFGPLVTAQYGGRVLWIATTAILVQLCYNLVIQRYALYCGESVLVGFLRTPPGARFWIAFYLVADLGSYWPYLSANAAVPLASVILKRLPTADDGALVRSLSYGVFLTAFVPLIFGGKIYTSLERVMVTKLTLILSYLGAIALFFVSWESKWEILSGLFRFGALPETEFSWATLAAFAAIAGSGGLTNIAFSNLVRDKGWGMGAHVGAIPSAVGGKTIKLSHTGKVFEPTPANMTKWRGWMRLLTRDQAALWAPACIAGMALPAMISYEFIRGARNIEGNAVAAMTARAIADRHGEVFWFLTLLCGFAILFPTQVSNLDGISRRWTDVIWMGSKRLRGAEGNSVKYVYYAILGGYGLWGLAALRLSPNPLALAIMSGVLVNFAMAFSAVHLLYVDRKLMPERLRAPWVLRAGLVACAVFYGGISTIALWSKI
jgi:hypothetical protein